MVKESQGVTLNQACPTPFQSRKLLCSETKKMDSSIHLPLGILEDLSLLKWVASTSALLALLETATLKTCPPCHPFLSLMGVRPLTDAPNTNQFPHWYRYHLKLFGFNLFFRRPKFPHLKTSTDSLPN